MCLNEVSIEGSPFKHILIYMELILSYFIGFASIQCGGGPFQGSVHAAFVSDPCLPVLGAEYAARRATGKRQKYR